MTYNGTPGLLDGLLFEFNGHDPVFVITQDTVDNPAEPDDTYGRINYLRETSFGFVLEDMGHGHFKVHGVDIAGNGWIVPLNHDLTTIAREWGLMP
jgi:hypothetical protein